MALRTLRLYSAVIRLHSLNKNGAVFYRAFFMFLIIGRLARSRQF